MKGLTPKRPSSSGFLQMRPLPSHPSVPNAKRFVSVPIPFFMAYKPLGSFISLPLGLGANLDPGPTTPLCCAKTPKGFGKGRPCAPSYFSERLLPYLNWPNISFPYNNRSKNNLPSIVRHGKKKQRKAIGQQVKRLRYELRLCKQIASENEEVSRQVHLKNQLEKHMVSRTISTPIR